MEQELKPQNIEHDKDVAEVVDDVPIALPPIPPVDLTLDFSSFMTEKCVGFSEMDPLAEALTERRRHLTRCRSERRM